jgi:hypothetical protein
VPEAGASSKRLRQWIALEVLNLADTVLASELVHPTGGIDDFLLTGIERMACRAHFDEEILTQGRTGREFVATAAGNLDITVGGMNLGFHKFVLRCCAAKKGA